MGSLRIIFPVLCLAMAIAMTGASGAARAEDMFGPLPPQEAVAVNGGGDGQRADPEPDGVSILETPLTSLTAMRLRPLFSPSRRPHVAPARLPPPAAAPAVTTPARPRITLLGTVVGDTISYGLFRTEPSGTVKRLRIGEEVQDGWLLRAVRGHEATLEKASDTTVLALPRRQNSAPADSAPGGAPAAGKMSEPRRNN